MCYLHVKKLHKIRDKFSMNCKYRPLLTYTHTSWGKQSNDSDGRFKLQAFCVLLIKLGEFMLPWGCEVVPFKGTELWVHRKVKGRLRFHYDNEYENETSLPFSLRFCTQRDGRLIASLSSSTTVATITNRDTGITQEMKISAHKISSSYSLL